ncbi:MULTISPECIES: hypothetical protein [unclassified Mycolicibacterium]|uniref:hypothetical protein n=1 Tax=unclassified Mycolicibacterium TaxID=2636767 RepID=UPI001F4C3FF2|nr:hypothetical protein [Mycolicibacterium sp. YH-1]UNB51810.1 hypothetical protein L0M16_28595 [Mycolicibacterium sp. YH-1]HET7739397.1 hypothetical protein [Mycobacterium sp.]
MPQDSKNSTAATLVGLSVAGAGIAHFVRPQLFEGITKSAFPRDTERHIKTNGGIETAIGVGLLVPKTRKLAVLGTVGYVAYLAVNSVRNR